MLLDARTTLNRFFFRGKLDAFAFRETVSQAIALVCGGRTDCTIRAYGEMVDVLWREGKCEEAIELEILWNDLAKRYAFSLLCGYAMGSFYKETDRRADICAPHTQASRRRSQEARTGRARSADVQGSPRTPKSDTRLQGGAQSRSCRAPCIVGRPSRAHARR